GLGELPAGLAGAGEVEEDDRRARPEGDEVGLDAQDDVGLARREDRAEEPSAELLDRAVVEPPEVAERPRQIALEGPSDQALGDRVAYGARVVEGGLDLERPRARAFVPLRVGRRAERRPVDPLELARDERRVADPVLELLRRHALEQLLELR